MFFPLLPYNGKSSTRVAIHPSDRPCTFHRVYAHRTTLTGLYPRSATQHATVSPLPPLPSFPLPTLITPLTAHRQGATSSRTSPSPTKRPPRS